MPRTDIRRSSKTHRARDLSRNVRQNVTVEIRHYNDIKLFGSVCKLCGSDIDDPVFLLNIGVQCTNLVVHLMEKSVRHLQNVVLAKAGNFFATVCARVLERIADDPLASISSDYFECLNAVNLF
jgi:hypothetical protein